jgi:UDP-N-acetylglucosamine--N-acetylmuramyl-(pentapeptide) pyrophosphoryl-undecaprenol N-acetylglucosamine transferase
MVGRAGGMEERLVPAAGFRLETIHVQGLNRDHLLRNAVLPVVIPAAFSRGVQLVEAFRPDVVLGVGGYVMAPALFGARRRHIPYVLAVFEARGLANRMFRSGAAAACVTFPQDVERFLTPRTVLTGYPLRPGFAPRSPAVPPRRLLVLGGSQGALRVNKAVWAALDGLLTRFQEVIHQTGAQGELEAAEHARPGYRPIAFTSDMPSLLGEADLVVCRAGVGTISEVTAVGLPMIVVPGTFGGGHQEPNALDLVAAGAAVRLGDAEVGPDTLLATIDELGEERLCRMAEASRNLGRPDAARAIMGVLHEVASAA